MDFVEHDLRHKVDHSELQLVSTAFCRAKTEKVSDVDLMRLWPTSVDTLAERTLQILSVWLPYEDPVRQKRLLVLAVKIYIRSNQLSSTIHS